MTRLGIVSDIHGNLPALEAVLSALRGEKVDLTISCGDLVGYGPWPGEVIARMREGTVGVQGNHDAAACGALSTDHFTAAARAAIDWIKERLDRAGRDYLSSLPLTQTVAGVSVVHGSPRGPLWEYILDPWTAGENFHLLATEVGLFGHSHIQGGFVSVGEQVETVDPRRGAVELIPGLRYLINPGSVGQPRDGDPRAAYAVLDLKQGKVIFRRVAYDIAATQQEIRRVGLPYELADRLSVGR